MRLPRQKQPSRAYQPIVSSRFSSILARPGRKREGSRECGLRTLNSRKNRGTGRVRKKWPSGFRGRRCFCRGYLEKAPRPFEVKRSTTSYVKNITGDRCSFHLRAVYTEPITFREYRKAVFSLVVLSARRIREKEPNAWNTKCRGPEPPPREVRRAKYPESGLEVRRIGSAIGKASSGRSGRGAVKG
ncbi:hypothetical protein KM043_000399 [Ampulex compressa]|nr:hypothetical protein KM043_000399 [Ampulex compressa]